jgi:hypothetical protein
MPSRWDRALYENNVIAGLGVALGAVRRVTNVSKFGANRVVDTGTVPETVWEVGGLYPYQSTPQLLEVFGGVNDDEDAAGTGAWTVEVQGLDANWEPQTATVVMNGVTPVAIPTLTWLRIFRAKVLTAGSTHSNVGAITIRIAGAGATLAQIIATLGQTTMATYTVPAGRTAFVKSFTLSVLFGTGGGGQADVALFVRDNAVANAAFQIKSECGGRSGASSREFVVPLEFTEKTDIEARVLDVSNNATSVTAEFDLVLVEN